MEEDGLVSFSRAFYFITASILVLTLFLKLGFFETNAQPLVLCKQFFEGVGGEWHVGVSTAGIRSVRCAELGGIRQPGERHR